MMKIKVVYLAAGMSSRFGGKPKQFAKVGPDGETLIEYSVKQSLGPEVDGLIFIINEKTKNEFKNIFGNSYMGVPVSYAIQEFDKGKRDKPWGTTDALCSAEKFIDGPFIMCNGDDIYGEGSFKKLKEHLEEKKSNAAIAFPLSSTLPDEGTVNRGTFELNADGTIRSIKENFGITKKNFISKGLNEDSPTNSNMFALYPETLEDLSEILKKFKENHKEDRKAECLLPVDLNHLIEKGLKINCYMSDEKWMGITNPGDEDIVRKKLKEFTST